MPKKIRAISFDTVEEINTLVYIIDSYLAKNKLFKHSEADSNAKKLLSIALEVQKMFFKGEKDAISK